MGLFRRIIYANFVPERIRDAAKIDELKKQNALLQKMVDQQQEPKSQIRMNATMMDEIRYPR